MRYQSLTVVYLRKEMMVFKSTLSINRHTTFDTNTGKMLIMPAIDIIKFLAKKSFQVLSTGAKTYMFFNTVVVECL